MDAKKQKLGTSAVATAAAAAPTPDPPSSHLQLVHRIGMILRKGAKVAESDEERTTISATIAALMRHELDATKVAAFVDSLPEDLANMTDDDAFAAAVAVCYGLGIDM